MELIVHPMICIIERDRSRRSPKRAGPRDHREGTSVTTDDDVRVLVVDDNPLLCAGLVRLLIHAGYRAEGATSVEEALATTRRATFDCGVFDIQLGFSDGLELARRLVAEGRVRTAVFFSATLLSGDRVRANRLGPFVSKSASVERVLEAVVTVVGASRKRP